MPKVNAPLYSLNGGEVGPEALARLDFQRMQFAGSLYSNILPRVVGSITLRPGLEHILDIDLGDKKFLEYNYTGTDIYIPVISDSELRIILNDELISRASVSTTITNGDFSSFTGWSDDSSGGGATASVSGGQLVLSGAEFNRSEASQTLTIAGADQNVEHGLRIKVARGPVHVRLGTAAGLDDLIPEYELDDGDFSLAFTPTGASAYLQLFHDNNRDALLDSCEIDASGTVVLETPWDDPASVQSRQSIDVLYCANSSYQQREIKRFGPRSWGVQRYKTVDGPFSLYTGKITLTPGAYTGNTTLTASDNLFTSTIVGRLYRVLHAGQSVETSFTGDPQYGDPIRVSGVGSARLVVVTVSGTWSGTVRLQVALDDGSGNPAGWTDRSVYTSNFGPGNYTVEDDNVIKYVRFATESGDYTSGTIETSLTYAGGSQSGICRVTAYNSPTSVDIEVLSRFYSTEASSSWDYSRWSDFDGWPKSVELYSGRLWWWSKDLSYGSVSDAFKSYDDTVEGDSAPIVRSINSGAQAGALWALGLQRLIIGTGTSEVSVRSSAYDEPLTAANWFPLEASTQGCADVPAVKVDKNGIFIAGDGLSIYQMAYSAEQQDYDSSELTSLHQEICDGSPVVDMFVQRKPDTMVWFILANGEARVTTYEPRENVIAWCRVTTPNGLFKRGLARRKAGTDAVYFDVERNSTSRLEKMATLLECRGGTTNCLMDSFKRFTVTTAQTVFDMSHLPDGTECVVWGEGGAIHDQSDTIAISGGNVTLASSVSNTTVIIGIPYNGNWKSTKLAYGAALGTALFQRKRVSKLGLYFVNTILDGVRVGRDENNLRQFTTTLSGGPLTSGELQEEYDGDLMPFNGNWDTDSRIYLRMQSPYPCTASALVMQVKTNDNG